MSRQTFNGTEPKTNLTPYVQDEDKKNISSIDVFSRLLVDRVIFLGEEIDNEVANIVQAELLYLNSKDKTAPIYMYINSNGGSVTGGLGIYDTMQFIDAPVYTICLGEASSMAAVLLAAGERGHRTALPNSTIMVHQPSWVARGNEQHVRVIADELTRTRATLDRILSETTGKTVEEIQEAEKDDHFMSAEEALKFGLIDEIKYNKSKCQKLVDGNIVTVQK